MKSKKSIRNIKMDKILSNKGVDNAAYSLKLIESFAQEFKKISQDDIDKSLRFIKDYRQKVRVEIDANPSLIKTLSQKWESNKKNKDINRENKDKEKNLRVKEKDDEESGSSGSSGDEIFITLWLLVGIESLTAAAQEELKALIDKNEAYKQFNTKVLDSLPKDFNQSRKINSPGSRISE